MTEYCPFGKGGAFLSLNFITSSRRSTEAVVSSSPFFKVAIMWSRNASSGMLAILWRVWLSLLEMPTDFKFTRGNLDRLRLSPAHSRCSCNHSPLFRSTRRR